MSRPRHAALRFPKNLRHLLASFAGVVPALVAPLNERRPHLLLQVSKELERGASENNEDGGREREKAIKENEGLSSYQDSLLVLLKRRDWAEIGEENSQNAIGIGPSFPSINNFLFPGKEETS